MAANVAANESPPLQPVVAVAQEPKEQSDRVDNDEISNTTAARPSIGQWIKMHWLDVLTLALTGALGLGVYFLRPLPSRSFPIYNLDGNIADLDNAYPIRKEIVPIWAAALLAALVPMTVFAFMQMRVRSFWDFNNAIFGLLYALVSAAVFQVFIKWLIGGLRPHFLEVCDPDPSMMESNGWGPVMYDRKVCRGDDRAVNDALESFPSGHSSAAFAGFVFLYLYLNAKLKVFSDYRPSYWKMVVLYMPILGAVLIGGALTIDKFHHWWDIVAGAIIGTMMAFSAYRMQYASIWNYNFNHVPLHPQTSNPGIFTHDHVWTRRAGWALGPAARPNSNVAVANDANMA